MRKNNKKTTLKIIETDRPFETVSEAVRFEVLKEIESIFYKKIAINCIKGIDSTEIIELFNELKKELKI